MASSQDTSHTLSNSPDISSISPSRLIANNGTYQTKKESSNYIIPVKICFPPIPPPGRQEQVVSKWLEYIQRARKRETKYGQRYANFLQDLKTDGDMVRKFLMSSEERRPVVRWLRGLKEDQKQSEARMRHGSRFMDALEADLKTILRQRRDERLLRGEMEGSGS